MTDIPLLRKQELALLAIFFILHRDEKLMQQPPMETLGDKKKKNCPLLISNLVTYLKNMPVFPENSMLYTQWNLISRNFKSCVLLQSLKTLALVNILAMFFLV